MRIVRLAIPTFPFATQLKDGERKYHLKCLSLLQTVRMPKSVRDMHCCKLGKGISLPNQQRARSIFRRCGQVYLEGNPVEPSPKETTDEGQALGSARVALACAFVSSGAAVALEDKAIEAGKGFAFKNRVFEIKEKGQVAVLLSFAAGR